MELTLEGTGETITFEPRELIIAGWTGRDGAAVEAHIAELEAIGIARPNAVPIFYRVDVGLLTSRSLIQTVGDGASGEVEPVLWNHKGELFVGLGSDHTDRRLETVGITLSKQLCAKPVGSKVWRWAEVAPHWDSIWLRSFYPLTGETYQEGPAGDLRRPTELVELYRSRGNSFEHGSVMFCGTMSVVGGIRFMDSLDLELEDTVRGRFLRHGYKVEILPIAEQ